MHMTVLGDSWDADIYDCQRTPETLTRRSSQLVRAHVRRCHGITCVGCTLPRRQLRLPAYYIFIASW